MQRVYRNAVAFLFDHCNLGIVPAQFWPFLDETGDPGEAMIQFLQAIGCDPDRIRRGDRAEREKAAEIIDFLVMSGDIFDQLSPEARDELGSLLEQGDYAKVRDAVRIAAALRAALDVEARWRGADLLPSFRSLLETVRKLGAHPLRASPDDAEEAARLARAYADAQVDFDDLCARYDPLVADLHDIWRSTGWSDGAEDAMLQNACAAFETARNGLRTVTDLNLDQVQYAVGGMRSNIEELQRLLGRARGHGGDRGADHDGDRPHGSEADRRLDEALAYFGWSQSRLPSLGELSKEWRDRHNELHKRNPPDLEAQKTDLNRFRDRIRDHLRGTTRAAA